MCARMCSFCLNLFVLFALISFFAFTCAEVGFMIAMLHSLDTLPFMMPTRPPQLYALLTPTATHSPASTSLNTSPTLSTTSSSSSTGDVNAGVVGSITTSTTAAASKKKAKKKVALIENNDLSGNFMKKKSPAAAAAAAAGGESDDFWSIAPAVLKTQAGGMQPEAVSPLASPRAISPQLDTATQPALAYVPTPAPAPTPTLSHHDSDADAAAALLEDLDLDGASISAAAAGKSATRVNTTTSVASSVSAAASAASSPQENGKSSQKDEWERLMAEQKQRIQRELQVDNKLT